MGESAAQTVREIEETRERLQDEIQELQDRLPQPAVWTKRVIGVAVGGGIAGTAFWMTVRRRRKARARRRAVAAPGTTVVQLVPDRWAGAVSEALEDGRWKPWVAGAAGAWVLFRILEAVQAARLRRALLAHT